MRVDYDHSTANIVSGDSSISGLQCSNFNRLLPSTCTVSQSFDISKTTTMSLSEEATKSSENSWGSEFTQSSSFTFSQSQQMSVAATVEAGLPGDVGKASATKTVTVGSEQEWSSTSQVSTSSGGSRGTSSSAGREDSWESTKTTTITCAASMEVAPAHSVSYSLIFDTFNTTINTYTDLKLTLCSALMHPERTGSEENSADYIYIDNIPGTITHKETTGL